MITVDLDDTTLAKLRDLRVLREMIRQTHAGLESCGGCSSCTYEKTLRCEVEGLVTWRVMEALPT